MNTLRRNVIVTATLLSIAGLAHAGLANLINKAAGKSGQVHIILIDDTGSITDADRGLYREAATTGLRSAVAGDRIVVAKISDATLGSFRAVLDLSIPDTGRHYDDLAEGKKSREKVASVVDALLVPVKSGKQTRILDVISALEPLISEATSSKNRVRLVMLTDAIEETAEVNMATAVVDDAWIGKVVAARQRGKLIPNLSGVDVYMVGGSGRTATQAKAIETFWMRYLSTAGAQLKFYGRTVPKLQ